MGWAGGTLPLPPSLGQELQLGEGPGPCDLGRQQGLHGCVSDEERAAPALPARVPIIIRPLLRSFKLLKIIQSTRNGLQSNASFHCIKQPS